MAVIYKIMVQCPETGRPVDSGIRTSGREAVNSGLVQAGTVACPHCHNIHSFERNSYLDVASSDSADELWRPNR